MVNQQEKPHLTEMQPLDHKALAEIYDAYQLPLYRYIYYRVEDVDTARDLTADVFFKFLRAVKNGSGPDRQVRAWLYRTAHNLVIDHYRRREIRRQLPLDEGLVDAEDNPAQAAADNLLASDVRQALHQLTPDQQHTIILKFFSGLSNEETACVLEKPVSAVKSLQHRALSALRRVLQEHREAVR